MQDHWHLPFDRTHIGETQTQPVSSGLSPRRHVTGDGEGLGEGSIEGLGDGSTEGDGDGSMDGDGDGSTEGDGEGLFVGGSHTATRGFTCVSTGTSVTVGSSNVGIEDPPGSIAVVPVGDTNTMFEFSLLAVDSVHGRLQNVVSGTTAVGASHPPDEAFPRRSNRITIGYERLSPTTRTLPRVSKTMPRDSAPGSSSPF